MKKLYLIGDSIRMNYDHYVANALEGQAEVYWPGENCRFAEYTCYMLGDWEYQFRLGKDLDVVHWNVGLHDVVHMHAEWQMTPPHIYQYYLERICDRLDDLYPNAQKVFATSTPVQEELYDGVWFYRKNSEIKKLNEVALEVMDKRGYLVNDLYSLVCTKDPKDIYGDKTHFNFKGCKMLACAVLEKVCPLMNVSYDVQKIIEADESRKDILR